MYHQNIVVGAGKDGLMGIYDPLRSIQWKARLFYALTK